jgi:C-terminal processing protease CtpA/Prc
MPYNFYNSHELCEGDERMLRKALILVLLIPVILAACSQTPTETEIAVIETEAAQVVEETETEEPTATLTGPRATAAALMAAVTVVPMESGDADSSQLAEDDYVGILRQAWTIVQENYVRDNFNGVDWDAVLEEYIPRAEAITDQEAFWDLLDEFVAELNDNHSRFVRPDEFAAEFDLLGATGRPTTGMRIWPAREDEQLMIWHVCQSGAAASAGLQRGDVILAINGEEVVRTEEGFPRALWVTAVIGDGSSNEVELLVDQGPETDPVEFTLRLGGASGCDGWAYEILNDSPRVGYIRIPDFAGDADFNILTAINAMEDDGTLDGLILDVRHNPGGNSDASTPIFTEGEFGLVGPLRVDATQTIYRIRGPVQWSEETPVVVLTDGSSHSAAEYFTITMTLFDRATQVGMPTAGNTEGITGFNLADGSIIRLAVMTLELPDGSTLEVTGVIPDVEVPLGDWGLRQVPDIQLQTALDILLGN